MSTGDAGPHHANARSTVLLIRHAEKAPNGVDLSVAGQARAQAYAVYFRNYAIGKEPPLAIAALFASADSTHSDRPAETIAPLAAALGLSPDATVKDKHFTDLAAAIRSNPAFADKTLLVCWHHGEILDLAAALGVKPGELPPSANWPAKWPGDVFGWVLQLGYDDRGRIDPSRTLCLNQKLMFGDHGRNPPAG